MPKKDSIDITMIIDRSGSMHEVKEEAQNGINSFIEEHKKAPGSAVMTVVEFDDMYSVLINAIDIQAIEAVELTPRGMTALYDSVGVTVGNTADRIDALAEDQKPEKVLFVIVTDGLDNASKEHTSKSVRALVEQMQAQRDWQFMFIGKGLDVVEQAGQMGLDPAATMAVGASGSSFTSALRGSTDASTRYREGLTGGVEYTEQELESALSDEPTNQQGE